MGEIEKWEIREKNITELLEGFLTLLDQLGAEQNHTPETQDRQFLQTAIISMVVNWLSDELQAAKNTIQHYKQGGN